MNFLFEDVECGDRTMYVDGLAAMNCHKSDLHRGQDPSFQVNAIAPEVTERAQRPPATEAKLEEIAEILGYTLIPRPE